MATANRGAPGLVLSNSTADSAVFNLSGGRYMVSVVGTNLSGSNYYSLQRLGPDASTFLDVKQTFCDADGDGDVEDAIIGKFTTNQCRALDLAEGQYKFVKTGSPTANYIEVSRAD